MSTEEAAVLTEATSAPSDALAGVMISTGDSDDYQSLDSFESDDATEADPEPDAPDPTPEPEKAEDQPETDAKEERVEFDDKQQEFLDKKLIPRFVAKAKAAEERAEAAERQLNELRSSQQPDQPQVQADPQTGEPVIPNPPDPFSSTYDEDLKARDEAIRYRAAWEAAQDAQMKGQAAQAQAAREALDKRTESYVEKGKEYGIDQADIERAGAVIRDSGGIGIELIDIILDDEAGPAITAHLARTPADLEKLQSLPPHRASIYLMDEVKKKATKNAKRRSAPPPPLSTEKGAGSREDDGPEGVTYE